MNTILEANDIKDIAHGIFDDLKKAKKSSIMPIFAFNGTGKTRLSNELINIIEENENFQKNNEIQFAEICKKFQITSHKEEKQELRSKKRKIGKIIDAERRKEIEKSIQNGEEFEVENNVKVLCFNAYFIDIFVWDNENNILKFNPKHYLMKLIYDEGIDGKIIATFRDFFLSEGSKLEPNFDFVKGEISFNLASGDNSSATNIKISKGEESIFIWTIFFVIIETIYDVYLDEKVNISEDENMGKNRWKIFENLEYIIIDDPVSSVDDTKIIDISMNLMSVVDKNHKKEYIKNRIKKLKENPQLTADYIKQEEKDLQENIPDLHLKFIITTHHALFYNICYNSVLKSEENNCKKIYKNNGKYFLAKQGDTPFLYHIHAKNIIEGAIADNDLQRFHFNLFRALLEKTANFLGYHSWDECLDDENRLIFAKILNNYSHGRFAESEPSDIPDNHKNIFIEEFQKFLQKFHFNK